MSDFSISPEWVLTELGEIVEIHSGVGFPKHLQGQVDEEIPLYKVSDISNAVLNSNSELYQANNYLSQEMADSLKGHYFRKGSTLFAKIGEAVKLNRRAEVGLAGLADNNVMGVSALSLINDRFIFHFLNTIDLGKRSRSSAIPSIRKSDIEELTILLPPKAEQEKIAELLDNHLAQVETIKARLNAIPEILKKFRQSVLADAVSGRLINFDLGKLETVKLTDVAEINPKKDKLSDDLAVSFSPMNLMPIQYGQPLQFEEKTWAEVKKGFTFFKENDVLVAKITPCFENGKSVVATNLINGIGTGSTEYHVIRTGEKLLPQWIFLHFKMTSFLKDGAINMTGSVGHKRVPKEFIENFEFQLPSLEEQEKVVERVEQLFSYADTIETQITNALQRVNQLTQSILHQAFTGKLTADWRANHPELITGDNSAEKLLEQIQIAKKTKGKPKSTKKVKNAT